MTTGIFLALDGCFRLDESVEQRQLRIGFFLDKIAQTAR
jgi:hypothetical protein